MEGQRAENGLLKNKKGGDEMPKRYKEARLMHKAKLTEMATKLGVSQPTLSAWESERKSAPVEAVIKMATLYTDESNSVLIKRQILIFELSTYFI